MASPVRAPVVTMSTGARRQKEDESSSVRPESGWETGDQHEAPPSSTDDCRSARPSVVEHEKQLTAGQRHVLPVPRGEHVHRRFRRRMGCHHISPTGSGHLESGRSPGLHQPQRTQSYSPGVGGVPTAAPGQECRDPLGQFHCPCLPEEGGRDTFCPSESRGSTDSTMGRRSQRDSFPPVHSGKEEHCGRFPEQTQRNNSFGVDSASGGGRRASPEVADFGGFVRHSPEPQVAHLLQPDSGPNVSGHRRIPAEVGSPGRLRLSPSGSDTKSIEQASPIPGHESNSYCPGLASTGMVCGSPRDAHRSPSGPALESRSTQTTSLPQEAPKSPKASSDWMETVRRFAKAKGFPEAIANKFALATRDSTNKQYQAKWNIFCEWCRRNGRSSSRATIVKLAEFLCYLSDVRKLRVPTIKGYRSMLAKVFVFKDVQVSSNYYLKELIKSFKVKELRFRSPTPHWDLDVVLRHLLKAPYEPLHKADFKSLSKKTIFLIALATAKRVGELQAISKHISFSGNKAFLQYKPDFVPKNDSISQPIPRDFELKALSDFVGRDMEEYGLCPVRALKYYLDRTGSFATRPRELFVQIKDKFKPMKKNTISFTIRRLIKDAHELEPPVDYPRGDIRAHSVRAVATSLNFMKNRSIADVMEAATWRGNNTFSSFYHKDVQRIYEHCRSLGPIVVGNTVIN